MPIVRLSAEPIDVAAVLDAVRSPAAGAVVLFLGTARETTGGRRTESLDYECYPEMGLKKLDELCTEALGRFALVEAAVVHRLGHLEPGEASVAIAVSGGHRDAAFAAGRWLIDEIKRVVPIWKRENWADGTSDWVHPGFTGADRPQET